MDENFDKDQQNIKEFNGRFSGGTGDTSKDDNGTVIDMTNRLEQNNDINRYSMDSSGNIRTDNRGGASIAAASRTYIILGWISAALTALISPYFAIPGVVFGVLANRQARGSGNAVIITNVVLAAISLLFGIFFLSALRRIMLGY